MDKNTWKKLLNENSLMEEAENPSPFDTLQKIVKNHQWDYIYLDKGGKVKMDVTTANMLMKVYGALKGNSAKEKFIRMLGTNKATLSKLVDFGWSMMK